MLNQLRADFYRLSHTMGIYLTLLVTIIYSAIITGKELIGGIIVSDYSMKELNSIKVWSLKDGINASTLSSSLLVYIFIGIFVMTIGYEFSQKTYKNTLVSGITRTQFIVSKYLIMLINIFAFSLIYFFTSIVTGMTLSRSVGTSWSSLLTMIFKTSLVIAFFISVIFELAILVLLLTSSIVTGSVFIVAFPILVATLHNIADWSWLKYFDFFSVALKISLKLIPNNQLWNYISISLVVVLITMVLSVVVIRNKEM
ncbi:ABC transporter permease [Companilactobacillus alimentarius]|uniref:Uncharacterized protein n=1 Tax=Companilactobacillus alimentarius DSM 20249 TaxID=1423720 RepID=A0A2K9HFZ4_9LACO|nr:ABC transporter permease [Companilactobacillus alimentarius]AUI71298.1 hypothetical protein LA20249_03385 [Companilactobacillus alimentarius DSM 20249]KRK75438.1 hypothetical protein FC67_GL001956 [Companilactobacillus alimentarius DSM 20249]GEO43776.1 ABC transporter [Companilactobacillus alimentarius]